MKTQTQTGRGDRAR